MNKLYVFCFLMVSHFLMAQNVTITPSGITPAMSGTYPRLSYDQIRALPSPSIGDMAYDNTFKCLRTYNGSKWLCTWQNPSEPTPTVMPLLTAGGPVYNSFNNVANMTTDAAGNVYVTGAFERITDFGGVSKSIPGFGKGFFVAKYNKDGVLQWVKTGVGNGTDYASGSGIVVDASGSVFVTGFFLGVIDFEGVSRTSTSASNDIFLAKYSSSGALIWLQAVGGTGHDFGSGVAIDGVGDVYVTGSFRGTVSFSGVSRTSVGGSADVYVMKYGSVGALQWVQTAGGGSTDEGTGITVDAAGKVYLIGRFQGATNFGGFVLNSASGSGDVFFAKYDPVGVSWTWLQSVGGDGNDVGRSIGVDANGDVYVSGDFSSTVDFGGDTKTSSGNFDFFLAKYDSWGTNCYWVKTGGGVGSDYAYGMRVDALGDVYVTGSFWEVANFSGVTKTTRGRSDVFVVKYDTAGAIQWVQTVGGSRDDIGKGIAIGPLGSLYVAGEFSRTANFGGVSITATGGIDFFVLRMDNP